MKIQLVSLITFLSTFFLSSTTVEAKKIQIDTHITSEDGCEWHVTGWVDISARFGWPPVEVNGFDITISGPCGTHHFTGGAQPNNTGGVDYYEANLYNEYGEPVPLGSFNKLNEIIIILDSEIEQ